MGVDLPSEAWTAGDPALFDVDVAGDGWSVILAAAPLDRPPFALRFSFETACNNEAVVAGRRLNPAAFLLLVDGTPGRYESWLLTQDCELALLVLEVRTSVANAVRELLDVAGGGRPGDVAAWRRFTDLDWIVHGEQLLVRVPDGPELFEGRWAVLSDALGTAIRRLPAHTAGYRVVGRFGVTSTGLLVARQPPDAGIQAVRLSGTVVFDTTVPVVELDALADWLSG